MAVTTNKTQTKKALKARTRVGAGGRIVIPAEIRRELGMEEGESVVMRVEDGELRIWTIDEAIRRVQERAKPYAIPGRLASDELIAERRAEVAREEEELRQWQEARAAEAARE
jgi:AbrB family looped-hinge helix DNA binding protein